MDTLQWANELSYMKKKHILVVDGHPRAESVSHALADAYAKSAMAAGHDVRLVHLRDLRYDPILRHRYRDNILEPDLLEQQENITWCTHLVIVTPVWWMGPPALLKGFLDRVITPGFAFKYQRGSWLPIPKRLLKGRSARIIYTQGGPYYLTNTIGFDAFFKSLKYATLAFCGFWPVRRTVFTRADKAKEDVVRHWVKKAEALGRKGK